MDSNTLLILLVAVVLGGCAYKTLKARRGRTLLATFIGAVLAGAVFWVEAAVNDRTGVTFVLFFVTIPVGAAYCLLPAALGAAIARATEASGA